SRAYRRGTRPRWDRGLRGPLPLGTSSTRRDVRAARDLLVCIGVPVVALPVIPLQLVAVCVPALASRPTDDEVTGPEEGDRDQGEEEGHGLGRKGEREWAGRRAGARELVRRRTGSRDREGERAARSGLDRQDLGRAVRARSRQRVGGVRREAGAFERDVRGALEFEGQFPGGETRHLEAVDRAGPRVLQGLAFLRARGSERDGGSDRGGDVQG